MHCKQLKASEMVGHACCDCGGLTRLYQFDYRDRKSGRTQCLGCITAEMATTHQVVLAGQREREIETKGAE